MATYSLSGEVVRRLGACRVLNKVTAIMLVLIQCRRLLKPGMAHYIPVHIRFLKLYNKWRRWACRNAVLQSHRARI